MACGRMCMRPRDWTFGLHGVSGESRPEKNRRNRILSQIDRMATVCFYGKKSTCAVRSGRLGLSKRRCGDRMKSWWIDWFGRRVISTISKTRPLCLGLNLSLSLSLNLHRSHRELSHRQRSESMISPRASCRNSREHPQGGRSMPWLRSNEPGGNRYETRMDGVAGLGCAFCLLRL